MKHTIHFTKMHGLGNDFVVIDGVNQKLDGLEFAQVAPQLCDRRFGIGADGILVIEDSHHSDLKMMVMNADGSIPEMCGNGIRCVAKFAYENKLVEKEIMSIETLAGVIVPAIIQKNGEVISIEVDMGMASQSNQTLIPTHRPAIQTIQLDHYEAIPISMGNPHAVVIVDSLQGHHYAKQVDAINQHFPEGVNIEFIEIKNAQEINMRVWERGAGETLACGTGACAAVVAGCLKGLLGPKVRVHLPAGSLEIEWQEDGKLIKTGPASTVYKGKILL